MKRTLILTALLGCSLAAAAQTAATPAPLNAKSAAIPAAPKSPAAVQPDKPPAGVTVDQLQHRMADLEKAYSDTQTHLNAIQGAMQETQYWIQQLTPKPSGPAPPNPK